LTPELTPDLIHHRRRLLNLSVVALARAARLSNEAVLLPTKSQLVRLDYTLGILEAGGTVVVDDPVEVGSDRLVPRSASEFGQVRHDTPLQGNCFGGDPDPGDGGRLGHSRPPTYVYVDKAVE
jgi:hypothetical protein